MQNIFHSTTSSCTSGLTEVISPKTGIVKSVGNLLRSPEEPAPHIVTSSITAFHRFSGNKADFASTGTSIDITQAHWSSLGESIERYCAALADFQTLTYDSYSGLKAKGHTPLPLEKFTLFSSDQYAQSKFPFTYATDHSKLSWIAGNRLSDNTTVSVPAGFVFNQFRPKTNELRLCPDIHPGVASSFSKTRALTGALLEIVERDTMMIHWLNQIPVTGIAHDEDFQRIRKQFKLPPQLKLYLALLETDIQVPCMFALLLDEKNGLLGGGCSAGFNAVHAAKKAVCEAIQILRLSKEVQNGAKGKLASKKAIPSAFLDPAARAKLPMTELLYNLGFYLNPQNWKHLEDFLSPQQQIQLCECKSHQYATDYQRLLENFINVGLEPVCIDLTTEDVADIGWQVVRVVAPGAVPNLPTLYPPKAVSRLWTVPRKLGFSTPSEWNTLPMPYA
ncbi:YcaO-like family protein [Halodesulfovibrio sp.]|jgi:ribosomal protein S12 methylthiotransferase accessory factor|uniref:YcaO-like family protein n=1 Tax=Halodesulfovibrio sp. TaxID=1912772 RepID=UPI0025E00F5A|nr:YcaO-like family protein [Halodesulfovibrio sp.]MCT4626401.1 YcaO-like family protein [Halodesulfovibrio sp.]